MLAVVSAPEHRFAFSMASCSEPRYPELVWFSTVGGGGGGCGDARTFAADEGLARRGKAAER